MVKPTFRVIVIHPESMSYTVKFASKERLHEFIEKEVGGTWDMAKVLADNGHIAAIAVHDTGLIDGLQQFDFNGYGNPLAGTAVVLGLTEHGGDGCDCPMELVEVVRRVRFSASLKEPA